MFQAPAQIETLYALHLAPAVAPGLRLPRPMQSAAAEALLTRLRALGADAAATSKSHSRALAAAAIGPGRIGIDVEYHDPRRDTGKIGRFLTDAPVADAAATYRAVTFWEAYFKAVGEWPERAVIRRAAASAAMFEAPGGLMAFFDRPTPDFTLCLVWQGGGAPRRVFNDDAR